MVEFLGYEELVGNELEAAEFCDSKKNKFPAELTYLSTSGEIGKYSFHFKNNQSSYISFEKSVDLYLSYGLSNTSTDESNSIIVPVITNSVKVMAV